MLERYWQGLGMALLLAGILFLFENANSQDVLLGRVLERIDNMEVVETRRLTAIENDISRIEDMLAKGVDDRYRAAGATKDFVIRDGRISELQSTGKEFEDRLDALERMIYTIKNSTPTPDRF